MVGVFDLGSNSFIALVVDKRTEILENVKITSAMSYLTGNRFTDCTDLKSHFLRMLDDVLKYAKRVHVFGTAVFREAENGEWCFEEIKGNLPGKILSTEEEAHYSYLSVAQDHEITVDRPVVFDLGGGSLEIVTESEWTSLPLGTRKISVNKENFWETVERIMLRLPNFPGDPVGIGGTFVTIAASILGEWNLKSVHGLQINMDLVKKTFDTIIDLSPEEIDELPFVPNGRGKTLKSGLAITAAIVKKFGSITVSRRGYRYAIAWELDQPTV